MPKLIYEHKVTRYQQTNGNLNISQFDYSYSSTPLYRAHEFQAISRLTKASDVKFATEFSTVISGKTTSKSTTDQYICGLRNTGVLGAGNCLAELIQAGGTRRFVL